MGLESITGHAGQWDGTWPAHRPPDCVNGPRSPCPRHLLVVTWQLHPGPCLAPDACHTPGPLTCLLIMEAVSSLILSSGAGAGPADAWEGDHTHTTVTLAHCCSHPLLSYCCWHLTGTQVCIMGKVTVCWGCVPPTAQAPSWGPGTHPLCIGDSCHSSYTAAEQEESVTAREGHVPPSRPPSCPQVFPRGCLWGDLPDSASEAWGQPLRARLGHRLRSSHTLKELKRCLHSRGALLGLCVPLAGAGGFAILLMEGRTSSSQFITQL